MFSSVRENANNWTEPVQLHPNLHSWTCVWKQLSSFQNTPLQLVQLTYYFPMQPWFKTPSGWESAPLQIKHPERNDILELSHYMSNICQRHPLVWRTELNCPSAKYLASCGVGHSDNAHVVCLVSSSCLHTYGLNDPESRNTQSHLPFFVPAVGNINA